MKQEKFKENYMQKIEQIKKKIKNKYKKNQ